ncbi:MAG TPA: RES family NAD+ phosphorylase [Chthoniobacterales bacterium]|jgi:RES domain-containing protein|nr:RES family NAD+ phosphorylase [Chthoniobacterales bacterium]
MSSDFPPPSPELSKRTLLRRRTPKTLVRLSRQEFRDPIFWSTKGKYRFDSPTARYGVLYTAASLAGAILEVFGDRWLEHRAVSEQLLRSYNLVKLNITPGLWLVNTLGSNLLFAGIDARLFASTDYDKTQAWGRAFMDHPQNFDGILYHSRKNPRQLNCAFFETESAQKAIRVGDTVPLFDSDDLYPILEGYEIKLL